MSLTVRRSRLVWFSFFCGVIVAAVLLARATTASAYVTIDSHCILRVWPPVQIDPPGGDQQVEGAVDCTGYGAVESEIEDCMQVQAAGGGFVTISGSCDDGVAYTNYNDLKLGEAGVCSRVYRTYDWGEDFDTGGENSTTSSAVTSCGIGDIVSSDSAAPDQTAQTWPAGLASAFPVFSQPGTTSDQLSAFAAPSSAAAQQFGLSSSASRLVLNSASGQTWLVPGSQGICSVTNGASPSAQILSVVQTSCDATATAETQGMFSVSGSTLTAIVPSGTGPVTVRSTGGASATAAPNADGVAVVTVAGQPSLVSYTGPNGQQNSVTLPATVAPPIAP